MTEYMNELINCVVCKKDIPRKKLYWDTIGSYTHFCEDCHNKKAIVEEGEKEILSENLFCFGKTLIANFINLFCKNRNEIEECKKKLIKFIQDFK